jgi:acyl-CoA thioester hydrolase
MGRVKIKFPEQKPLFTATIPVRIGDINYGNHVGNDAILSIVHESRMQMLGVNGYTEMNAAGNSMIMADVMIAYKGEAFYSDVLSVHIYAEEVGGISFDLLYHITTTRNGEVKQIAHCKTGMVCFDYTTRKTTGMTDAFKEFLIG